MYCIFIVSCNRYFRISVFALNYVIVRIKGCCDLKGYALDRSGYWNAWKTSELSKREREIFQIVLRVLRKEMKYIMHAYNTPDNLVWYNAHFWREDVRRVIWSFVLKKQDWEHWLWIALQKMLSCFSSKVITVLWKRSRTSVYSETAYKYLKLRENPPLIFFLHFDDFSKMKTF